MDVSDDVEIGVWYTGRNTHAPIGHETCRSRLKNNRIGGCVSVIGDIFEGRHETRELTSVTVELCGVDVSDDTETTRDGHSTSHSRERLGRIRHVDIPHHMEIGGWRPCRNTHLSVGHETCRRILKDNHVGHGVSVIGDIFESRDQTGQL